MSDNPTTMPEPLWVGPCRLYWRTDDYGKDGRALYVGGLQIGTIMYIPKMYAVGGIERVNEKPWRAWLMTDSDGMSVGWFLTEQEAKDALADAAVREIGNA